MVEVVKPTHEDLLDYIHKDESNLRLVESSIDYSTDGSSFEETRIYERLSDKTYWKIVFDEIYEPGDLGNFEECEIKKVDRFEETRFVYY